MVWHMSRSPYLWAMGCLLWVFLTWWRHHMETFSALVAICAGNSPVPVEYCVCNHLFMSWMLMHGFECVCLGGRLCCYLCVAIPIVNVCTLHWIPWVKFNIIARLLYLPLYTGITLSVSPSVRLWTESCPLCIFNHTHRIHFIFAHLIKQLQKVWSV